jgi:YD repeat-containing protein
VLDNLVLVEQGSQTRTFTYDSLDRLTSATTPEVCEQQQGQCVPVPVTYEYFPNGSLKKRTDARGVDTNYTYDALNRLTSRVYTDGTPSVSYFYDSQALPNGAPTFNRGRWTGRLIAVTQGGGFLGHYSGGYDELGRAKLSRQVTDTPEGAKTYEMAYVYDLDGNLRSETYPSGRAVEIDHDTAGRVAGVKDATSGEFYVGSGAGDVANRILYAAHGAPSSVKLRNGLWEHVNFNSRLQPTQERQERFKSGHTMLFP